MSELFNCPLFNVAKIGIKRISVFENAISTFVLPPTFCIGKQCRFLQQIPTEFVLDISEAQVYCGILTSWYVLFPTMKISLSGTFLKAYDRDLRKFIEKELL